MPSIDRIPDEILLCILKLVVCDERESFLNILRAGNERFYRLAMTVWTDRRTIVYLQPTTKSLQRFKEVCEDSFLSTNIREVHYVPTMSSHRLTNFATFLADEHVTQITGYYYLSYTFLREVHASHLRQWYDQKQLHTSGELVKTMVDCLRLLPRLETLVSDPFDISRPLAGFNMPLESADKPPSLTGAPLSLQWLIANNETVKQSANQALHWAIARRGPNHYYPSLPTLQASAGLPPLMRPCNVELVVSAPFLLQPALAHVFINRILNESLGQVTTLRLSILCEGRPPLHSPEVFSNKLHQLLQAAPNLTSFHIDDIDTRGTHSTAIHRIWQGCYWPGLQEVSFMLPYLHTISMPVSVEDRDTPSDNHLCLDLKAFLIRHRSTLTHLALIQGCANAVFPRGPQLCTTTTSEVRNARAWVQTQLLVINFIYLIDLPTPQPPLPAEAKENKEESDEAVLIKRYYEYPAKMRELQRELIATPDPDGRFAHRFGQGNNDMANFSFKRLLE